MAGGECPWLHFVGHAHTIFRLGLLYFGGTRVLFIKCAAGIPIVYFEKNRVFKAGVFALEYVSMG